MKPKISVIIPVYKVEPYLRKCLDSVVNQTYRNLEIIIVDDGSPDNCGKICDEYAVRDERIWIIHKENAGVSAARNDGIRLATGEWIAFADSDDWYDLDYFEKMVDSLTGGDIDVFLAGGCYAESAKENNQVRTFGKGRYDKNVHDRSFLLNKTLAPRYGMEEYPTTSSLGVPWNKLYRTVFLRDEDLYFPLNLHPLEDTLFNIAVFCAEARVAACDCMGYHFRTAVESSSQHRFNPNWPKMDDTFMNELFQIIGNGKEWGVSEEAINARVFHIILYELNCYFFHPNNPMTGKEIVCEMHNMKKKPYFHDAIYTAGNKLITRKRRIIKFLLRLPWVWPLKLLYTMKQTIRGRK